MADITVGGKGFEGVIATFNTSCVTNIKITPTVDWVDFTIETNTVNARVEAYTGDNPRQQSFTLSFTALTENDNGSESETACAKNFSIEQLSKNFHPEEGGETPPEPPVGCMCLVDNCAEADDKHVMTVSSEAKETCDSAHAPDPTKYEVKEIAYTTDIEDESSWVVSSTGWLTARIEHTDGCNVGNCNGNNVGAKYIRTENDTGKDRYARVKWGWQSGVEIPECSGMKMCEFSYTYIKQLGGETPPSEPCDVKLTLSGLEGTDKATINWGDGNRDNDVGNEQRTHTYSTGGKHTASITANGYKSASAEFNCDGTTEISKTMEKGAGDCNCDTMILVMGKTEFTLESAANSQDSTIVSWNSSCPPYIDNEASSWLDAQFVGGGDGDFEVNSITKNDGTEDRVGTIKIYANSSKESVCKTLTVTQKHSTGPCEEDYTIKYGITFENDCLLMDSTAQAAANITIRELVLDYLDDGGVEKQLRIKESSSTNQITFMWSNVVDSQTIQKTFTQKLPCDITIKGVHGDSRWFSCGSMFICESCIGACSNTSESTAAWCGDFEDTNGTNVFTKYAGGGLSNTIQYTYETSVQNKTIFIQMNISNAFA